MREFSLICTIEASFNLNNQVYIHKGVVNEGIPLGSTFADYYMASKEKSLLSQDGTFNPKNCKRYLDDILAVLNETNYVNCFKTRMIFHHEEFSDNDVHFLNISFKNADNGSCHTAVYIKPADTDI